jgi:retinol dehydrogenase-14
VRKDLILNYSFITKDMTQEGRRICLITGCNTGIGKVTAIELAKDAYEIIMLVRDSEKSREAFEDIKRESGGKVVLKYADLASLDSIKHAVEEIKSQYERIDVLINNAGIFKRKYEKSADAFEMSLAVNYYATYALTLLLLPLLRMSKQARVINLTSALYTKGKVNLDTDFDMVKFDGTKAYANSKLLVVYFTQELALRLKADNITVNCVHPGVVGTDVFREYPKWFSRLMNLMISKPAEGAEPSIYLARSEDLNQLTGKYFHKSKQKAIEKWAQDTELSKKIWTRTEELTGISYTE